MKKAVTLLLAVFMLFGAAAYAELKVTATLFPQYDFARRIGGENVQVTKLLPMGADSHSFEPTVRQMLDISESDLFLYTDPEMEPWAEKLIGGIGDGVTVVRCADGIDLEALHEEWEENHEHEDEEEEEHDHHHSYDAHIWLDPMLAVTMCENIRDAFIAADPDHEADYTANAESCIAELTELDGEFAEAASQGGTLVFGGRFAYSHFLRRYNLDYITAYSSCDAESEPSARKMVRVIATVNDSGAKIVFTDELSDGRIAQAIADETGAEVRVFHTLHNSDSEEDTYFGLMRRNLEYIKEALR